MAERKRKNKSLKNAKAFAKIKCYTRWEVFADFQGAFFKKLLEARFGTAVPTYNGQI